MFEIILDLRPKSCLKGSIGFLSPCHLSMRPPYRFWTNFNSDLTFVNMLKIYWSLFGAHYGIGNRFAPAIGI